MSSTPHSNETAISLSDVRLTFAHLEEITDTDTWFDANIISASFAILSHTPLLTQPHRSPQHSLRTMVLHRNQPSPTDSARLQHPTAPRSPTRTSSSPPSATAGSRTSNSTPTPPTKTTPTAPAPSRTGLSSPRTSATRPSTQHFDPSCADQNTITDDSIVAERVMHGLRLPWPRTLAPPSKATSSTSTTARLVSLLITSSGGVWVLAGRFFGRLRGGLLGSGGGLRRGVLGMGVCGTCIRLRLNLWDELTSWWLGLWWLGLWMVESMEKSEACI
ncbi:hypothetical protein P171DRAFT_428200, partial [Karstenula rhodostoma CBS 690.94]